MVPKDGPWFMVVVIIISLQQAVAKRCMRNDDIGWREGNIYYCEDPVMSECCERNRQFTCCEFVPRKTMREQFQLWGAVFLFTVTLSAVFIYYRRDASSPCCSDTPVCSSCCTGSSKAKHTFSSKKGVTHGNQQSVPTDDSAVDCQPAPWKRSDRRTDEPPADNAAKCSRFQVI